MLAENAFRRGVESTTVPTLRRHHHEDLEEHLPQQRGTYSASSASPMDDRPPLASPSRVVTGFAASAASSYDGGVGVGPGAASPPVASPRARAVARALLGEALDADAKTRVVGLGGAMDNTSAMPPLPMNDSVKSEASVLSGSLYDDLDDAVGGRPRSRIDREEDEEDEARDDAVNCGFARSSPIDIPTWDRKPAHWKMCV